MPNTKINITLDGFDGCSTPLEVISVMDNDLKEIFSELTKQAEFRCAFDDGEGEEWEGYGFQDLSKFHKIPSLNDFLSPLWDLMSDSSYQKYQIWIETSDNNENRDRESSK